jgi:hypothetical protein
LLKGASGHPPPQPRGRVSVAARARQGSALRASLALLAPLTVPLHSRADR